MWSRGAKSPDVCSICRSRSRVIGTESKTAEMSLVPLMFRSLVRLVSSMAIHPAASVTTVLFYSDLLPQSIALERLVRRELLHEENYLLHLHINSLRCFL